LPQDIQFQLVWPPVTVAGTATGNLLELSIMKWAFAQIATILICVMIHISID
jgi:hypothetical protein